MAAKSDARTGSGGVELLLLPAEVMLDLPRLRAEVSLAAASHADTRTARSAVSAVLSAAKLSANTLLEATYSADPRNAQPLTRSQARLTDDLVQLGFVVR